MKRLLGLVLLIIITFIPGCIGNQEKAGGTISASGTIEGEETQISAEVAGRITGIKVEEGQRVKKGELLAQLESTIAQLQVKQAQAQFKGTQAAAKGAQAGVKGAQAKLEDTKAGSRIQQLQQAQENIRQLEAMLAGATKGLENTKKSYDKVQYLYQEGSASEQELLNIQGKYDSSLYQQKALQAQLAGAREQYKLLKAGATTNTVKAVDANLQQAKSAQEQVVTTQEQAQLNLALAEAQLAKTIIYAPTEGVISSRNFNVGELALPGKVLFSLMNPDKLWIRVYLPETDLAKIKLNQEAKVRIDGYPRKVFKGKVTTIAAKAEFTPKNIQTKEERVNTVFAVKLTITNQDQILKAGLPADVEFVQ